MHISRELRFSFIHPSFFSRRPFKNRDRCRECHNNKWLDKERSTGWPKVWSPELREFCRHGQTGVESKHIIVETWDPLSWQPCIRFHQREKWSLEFNSFWLFYRILVSPPSMFTEELLKELLRERKTSVFWNILQLSVLGKDLFFLRCPGKPRHESFSRMHASCRGLDTGDWDLPIAATSSFPRPNP